MGLADETVIVFTSDNGALNRAWNNEPLRGAKGQFYEGGIRVPLIVKWLGMVQAGSRSETATHIVDLFPTFKEIANGSVPADKKLYGKSLIPIFTRQGDYKLIHYYGDYLNTHGYFPIRGEPYGELVPGERVELFNIAKDPWEQHDLSRKLTEKREELLNKLNLWLQHVDASIPRQNPDSDISAWYETTSREKHQNQHE